MSNNLQTGLDHLSKAKAFTKSSLFSLRFSPDWDSTQRCCRRAIESFKFCGDEAWPHLLEAYQLGIEAFEHSGQYQQCGIFSDEAGDLAVKLAEKNSGNVEYYQKAIQHFIKSAKYFRLSNNVDKNSAILLKGSECYLKINDKENAIALLEKSCSNYEDDYKLVNAEKFLSQAFNILMQLNEYQRAIQWLQYQIKILANRKDMYANTIYHNLAEEIIILLFMQKYSAADIRLQQTVDNDEYDFMNSAQYLAARDLIQACNDVDNEDAIQECRKKHVILKYLDRNVALLVPKLKININATSKQNDDDIHLDDEKAPKTDNTIHNSENLAEDIR